MWLLWYRPQRFLLCCLLATEAKNHADKRPKQIVLSQQRIKLVVVLLQDARLLWWGLWKGIQLDYTHSGHPVCGAGVAVGAQELSHGHPEGKEGGQEASE